MHLKLFILISILVHLVGGVGIYFYYNPPEQGAFRDFLAFFNKDLVHKSETLKEPLISLEEEIQKPKLAKKQPKPIPKTTIRHQKTNSKKSSSNLSHKKSPPSLKPSSLTPKPKSTMAKKAPQKKAVEKLTLAQSSVKNPEVKNKEGDQESKPAPQDKESDQKSKPALKITVAQNKEVAKTDPLQEEAKPQSAKQNLAEINVNFKSFFDLKQQDGNPSLEYPEFARKDKLQGEAIVIYYVTPSGLVESIQLEKTSGHSPLDNFVLRTLARYRFLPDQEGWVRHPVQFILQGEEQEKELRLRE